MSEEVSSSFLFETAQDTLSITRVLLHSYGYMRKTRLRAMLVQLRLTDSSPNCMHAPRIPICDGPIIFLSYCRSTSWFELFAIEHHCMINYEYGIWCSYCTINTIVRNVALEPKSSCTAHKSSPNRALVAFLHNECITVYCTSRSLLP